MGKEPRTARSDPPPPAKHGTACCESHYNISHISFVFHNFNEEYFRRKSLRGGGKKLRPPAAPCPRQIALGLLLHAQDRFKIASKIDPKKMSFWSRFGLPLGSSWAPKFGQDRSKRPPRSLQEPQDRSKTPHDDHLYAKKCFFL